MIYNIISNPIILLTVLSLLITITMFLFVGNKKKSTKKIEKVIEKKEEKKIDDKVQEEDDIILKTGENFDLVESDDVNNGEKKITKVYIRKNKNRQIEEINNLDESKYEEMSKRAEFVRTSKNISKLSNFNKKTDDELVGDLDENHEECDVCNDIKLRINHDARLSKCIKEENFDSLFRSHLSEHYMNIDSDRHISEHCLEKLFERTDELFKNSENKILENPELKTDKEKLRYIYNEYYDDLQKENVIEDRKNSNDNINLKSLMVASALLRRKKH